MSDKNAEINQKLRSIQAKVRDIESSNAKEVCILKDKVNDLIEERDVLKRKVAALEFECSSFDEKILAHNESCNKLHTDLEMERMTTAKVINERDQLQESMGHMEKLLKDNRERTKMMGGELSEMQTNYESRIEELETTIRNNNKELKKNKDLKKMISNKSEEVGKLQDIVQKECIERTLLKAELAELKKIRS